MTELEWYEQVGSNLGKIQDSLFVPNDSDELSVLGNRFSVRLLGKPNYTPYRPTRALPCLQKYHLECNQKPEAGPKLTSEECRQSRLYLHRANDSRLAAISSLFILHFGTAVSLSF